jgi:hypothetical protein
MSANSSFSPGLSKSVDTILTGELPRAFLSTAPKLKVSVLSILVLTGAKLGDLPLLSYLFFSSLPSSYSNL